MARTVKPEKPRTLADVDLAMLECRLGLLGHDWRWGADDNITMNTRNVPIEMTRRIVCSRCECAKRLVISLPSFAIMRESRTYPPGYLVNGGRVRSNDVRSVHFEKTSGITLAKGRRSA